MSPARPEVRSVAVAGKVLGNLPHWVHVQPFGQQLALQALRQFGRTVSGPVLTLLDLRVWLHSGQAGLMVTLLDVTLDKKYELS